MQTQREKRFVIRNAEEKYLCYCFEKMAYEWRAEDEFDDGRGPTLTLNYRSGMRLIAESYRPKVEIVGNSYMVGVDYPDMSTAQPCIDHNFD